MKIEFRGKSDIEELEEIGIEHNNGWVYGSYVDGFIVIGDRKQWSDVDPKTVGQYTELKDLNDRKIFEGDIVKHAAGEYSFIGVITKDRYVFYIKGNTDNFDLEDVSNTVNGTTSLQVIGNIHDNPEYLEVSE